VDEQHEYLDPIERYDQVVRILATQHNRDGRVLPFSGECQVGTLVRTGAVGQSDLLKAISLLYASKPGFEVQLHEFLNGLRHHLSA
jgi:hypothetical protein